jgi:arylsulfatase A-like enzyme
MTGMHTGHTHVRGNGSRLVDKPYPLNRVPLRPQDTTVAQVLKKAGYVTGITGKWGLGEPGTTGIPNKKGFDEWMGFLNQNYAHNYYPEYIWQNEEKYPLLGNLEDQEGQYVHDFFINFALDFIEQYQDTSFFLYYSITLPHAEYEIPESDLAPFVDQPWEDNEKVQAAMVTRLDREVGRMVSLLKDLGLDQKTLVFFCSDNGAAERWEGRFDSSGKLRGRKRDMYEGGIRTPMIAWMPGNVPQGKVSDHPWYFTDVLPTLAELAGVKAPADIDGISDGKTGRPCVTDWIAPSNCTTWQLTRKNNMKLPVKIQTS